MPAYLENSVMATRLEKVSFLSNPKKGKQDLEKAEEPEIKFPTSAGS